MTLRKPVAIPRAFPGELKREVLLQKIKTAQDHKMIALLAPSGYGKTTVLAQFVRSSRRGTVWLTLGEAHQEHMVFMQALYQALQDARVIDQFPIRFDHQADMVSEHLAELLIQTLNDLRSNIYLVIDKIEHLSAKGTAWLSRLISRLPEGHQVLVSGYDSTHFDPALLQNATEVLVLGIQDLAFSPQETHHFLETHRQSWNPQLHQQSQGWPVAVHLQSTSGHLGMHTTDWIRERIEQLPEPFPGFLPELVVHRQWTHDMPDLEPWNLSSDWINQLMATGLPITRLNSGIFIPHDLLIETLDLMLQERPAKHQQLYHQHALLQQAQGNWMLAHQYHHKIGEMDQVFEILLETLPRLSLHHEFGLIKTILSKFQLQTLPFRLQVMLAAAHVDAGELDQVLPIIDPLIAQGFEDSSLYFTISHYHHLKGDYHTQLEWLEKEKRLPADQRSTENGGLFLSIHALQFVGRTKEALELGKELLKKAMENQSIPNLVRAHIRMGDLYGEDDFLDLEKSEYHYNQALALTKKHQLTSMNPEIYHNLSITLTDMGQDIKSLTLLNEILLSPFINFSVWKRFLLGMRAATHVHLRDLQSAIRDFNISLELENPLHYTGHAYDNFCQLSIAHSALGNFPEAQKCLNALQMFFDEPFPPRRELSKYSKGLFLFFKQEFTAAEEVFRSINLDQFLYFKWEKAQTMLFLAELGRRRSDLNIEYLHQLFSFLDTMHGDQALRQHRDVFHDLYQHCIQQGIYAERIQAALNEQPTELQEAPLILNLQLLGKFKLILQDRTVRLKSKKSELLLALLALQHTATRDQILDALWDGQKDTKTINSFKMMVRKLRTELAQTIGASFDPLPFHNDHYQLHPELQVICDVQQLLNLKPDTLTLQDLEHWAQVSQEGFLPGMSSLWANNLRRTCQERSHELLLLLGHRKAASDPVRAIQIYEQLLEQDPHNPLLWQELQKIQQTIS